MASRPYMPGYGTLPAGEGTGLLLRSRAVAQLSTSPRTVIGLQTADFSGSPTPWLLR